MAESSYGPGFEAIGEAFVRLYGAKAENLTFRSVVPVQIDPHPCKMVTSWKAPSPPHWHLVTFGLTELFEKISDIPDQSGWGFELTLRLPRGTEDGPTSWAVSLLRSLVEMVESTGKPFGEDHYIPLPGRFGGNTQLTGLTFAQDPSFEPFGGPFGRMYFLQAIGITADELTAVQRSNDRLVVKELKKTNPMLITDVGRHSVFEGPGAPPLPPEPAGGTIPAASMILNELVFCRSMMGWNELVVERSEKASVRKILHGRITRGVPFVLSCDATRVTFRPAPRASWSKDEAGGLLIDVTPASLEEICQVLGRTVEEAVELPSYDNLRIRS